MIDQERLEMVARQLAADAGWSFSEGQHEEVHLDGRVDPKDPTRVLLKADYEPGWEYVASITRRRSAKRNV